MRRNKWFDVECEEKIERKDEDNRKWIKPALAKNLERYKQKRKESNIYCNKKKEMLLNEIMQDIEISSKDNRKLF